MIHSGDKDIPDTPGDRDSSKMTNLGHPKCTGDTPTCPHGHKCHPWGHLGHPQPALTDTNATLNATSGDRATWGGRGNWGTPFWAPTHDVGALGLEGVGATGVEVGAVVALQEAHVVEAVGL